MGDKYVLRQQMLGAAWRSRHLEMPLQAGKNAEQDCLLSCPQVQLGPLLAIYSKVEYASTSPIHEARS